MKNPFKKYQDDRLKVAYATGFITPKRIIMDAIKTRLTGSGCVKMILTFPVDSDNYIIMLKNDSGENTKFEIDKSEISLIKKIFVKRIISAWNEKNPDIEPKSIQILIDILSEDIEVFIDSYYGKIFKFDF